MTKKKLEIDALLAKIDASPAEADQKQVLRGLVGTVRRQPTMADVAKMSAALER